MTLNYGVVRINSSWQLACYDLQLSVDWDISTSYYPGDVAIGFSFGTTKRKIILTDTRFKTIADGELFLSNVQTLNEAGVAYKIEWAITASPTYFKFDGTQAYIMGFVKKAQNLIQEGAGYQTIVKIQRIEIVEGSKS